MENQRDVGIVADRPRSDSKKTGEKRGSIEFAEQHSGPGKKVKMRHLDSLGSLQGNHTSHSKSLKQSEGSESNKFDIEEVSQVTEVPVTVDMDVTRHLDLNTEIWKAKGKAFEDDTTCVISKGIDLDLNTKGISNSMNKDQFSIYKNQNLSKARDISECGSTTGPLEENDPLKVWREMKQNGFLSSSHGGIPIPKQRGRKSKNDMLKKKMELAKKEQVDRFTKIAAPSGLLNELNPGIINHVRNRKQVHSIIEALVRSEKNENSQVGNKPTTNMKSESTEVGYRKNVENTNDSGLQGLGSSSREDGSLNALFGYSLTQGFVNPMSMNKPSLVPGQSAQIPVEKFCVISEASNSTLAKEDDTLALKLSSSFKASENQSPLCNEDPSLNLSIKAATVASQWLELLQQDIKGRLSALKRSKKRVRVVISTELPFLIEKEFPIDKENEHCVIKSYADMHRARWSSLFDQMDKALSEEEKQLETWSNQVKQMQLHCEQGLQLSHRSSIGIQQMGALDADSRSWKEDEADKELAVRAAAASIYSTCNFLSTENVSCC